MRLLVRVASAFPLAAALALAASCGSDGGGGGSSDYSEPAGATWEDGEPVQGNVTVAWKNLDPKNQAASRFLVNESSETGQKMKRGATASDVGLLTDVQMGGLLAKLTEIGFFRYATDGTGLDNVPDLPGLKGIVVVTRDGASTGLLFRTNLDDRSLAQSYVDAKKIILLVHSQVIGPDVRANVGEPDERVFEAPPIRMKR
jgi:hypothetical protein